MDQIETVYALTSFVKARIDRDVPSEVFRVFETAVTKGIRVEVKSSFLPGQSEPGSSRFYFSYHIKITNNGPTRVQLVSRQWLITDGLGRSEEVKGPGVIGQQPQLNPGESFEYESFCPLSTPTGTMKGTYQMLCLETQQGFQAEIPEFFLVEPSSFH